MKKTVFLLSAVLLGSNVAFAEMEDDKGKHEISVSYGAAPASYVCDGSLGTGIGTAVSAAILSPFGGNVEGTSEDKTTFGVINLDYAYHVTSWLGIGFNASYSQSSYDVFQTKTTAHYSEETQSTQISTDRVGKIADKDFSFITVMPTFKANWLRFEHISLYSRLSLGVTFRHKTQDYVAGFKDDQGNPLASVDEHAIRFMGHVSPIGIEAGWEHARAFVELGFGQCGVAQAGLRFRF